MDSFMASDDGTGGYDLDKMREVLAEQEKQLKALEMNISVINQSAETNQTDESIQKLYDGLNSPLISDGKMGSTADQTPEEEKEPDTPMVNHNNGQTHEEESKTNMSMVNTSNGGTVYFPEKTVPGIRYDLDADTIMTESVDQTLNKSGGVIVPEPINPVVKKPVEKLVDQKPVYDKNGKYVGTISVEMEVSQVQVGPTSSGALTGVQRVMSFLRIDARFRGTDRLGLKDMIENLSDDHYAIFCGAAEDAGQFEINQYPNRCDMIIALENGDGLFTDAYCKKLVENIESNPDEPFAGL